MFVFHVVLKIALHILYPFSKATIILSNIQLKSRELNKSLSLWFSQQWLVVIFIQLGVCIYFIISLTVVGIFFFISICTMPCSIVLSIHETCGCRFIKSQGFLTNLLNNKDCSGTRCFHPWRLSMNSVSLSTFLWIILELCFISVL